MKSDERRVRMERVCKEESVLFVRKKMGTGNEGGTVLKPLRLLQSGERKMPRPKQ